MFLFNDKNDERETEKMEDRRFKFLVLGLRTSTCCIRYFVLASLFLSSSIYAASLFLLIGLMSAISGSSSVSHCSPTFTWIDFFGIYPSAPSAAQK